MNPTCIYVKTDHSEANLFGEFDPPKDYDADTLLDSLTQAVQKAYPDATISVMATHGQTSTGTDGGPEVEDTIGELINRTWADWPEQV